MKQFFLIASIMFSTNVFAKNIFWCEPTKRLKKLEAVIIREEDGKRVLAVYTESKRWGTVDEKIEVAQKALVENQTSFFSQTSSISFNLNTDNLGQGDIVLADFFDTQFNIGMKVSCEYLP